MISCANWESQNENMVCGLYKNEVAKQHSERILQSSAALKRDPF